MQSTIVILECPECHMLVRGEMTTELSGCEDHEGWQILWKDVIVL